jgi:hypothetical protein
LIVLMICPRNESAAHNTSSATLESIFVLRGRVVGRFDLHRVFVSLNIVTGKRKDQRN